MNRTATTSTLLNGAPARFQPSQPNIVFDMRDSFPPIGLPRMAVAQKFKGTNTTQTDAPEEFQPIITPRRVRSRLHPEKRAAVRSVFLTVLVISLTTAFIIMQKRSAGAGRRQAKQESTPAALHQLEELWNKSLSAKNSRAD
ncbi:hypothetical protein [Prosthecobacter vanneervenii]|uniref:Transmembrane protein n=1 Tax=Prosthecobacter vanneervenii TaxID=48466 RepID=A0A7W7YCR0_9BACT|nr:hypothetical protein [Prosthecobacter vanneervenii]MBB5033776.1 hypothetical protein [Prosthecobacter vanneervenii]